MQVIFLLRESKMQFIHFCEPKKDKISMKRLKALSKFSTTRTTNIDRIKVHIEEKSSVGHCHDLQLCGSNITKTETNILRTKDLVMLQNICIISFIVLIFIFYFFSGRN